MLAYVYTIHKVHMLTIPNIVVTLGFPESTGQIYVCRIFAEHSHDTDYRNIPWMFHEYPTNVTWLFLVGSINTIVVFSSG